MSLLQLRIIGNTRAATGQVSISINYLFLIINFCFLFAASANVCNLYWKCNPAIMERYIFQVPPWCFKMDRAPQLACGHQLHVKCFIAPISCRSRDRLKVYPIASPLGKPKMNRGSKLICICELVWHCQDSILYVWQANLGEWSSSDRTIICCLDDLLWNVLLSSVLLFMCVAEWMNVEMWIADVEIHFLFLIMKTSKIHSSLQHYVAILRLYICFRTFSWFKI